MHSGSEDAAVIAEAMGPDYEHFQATAQLRRGVEQANALIWRKDAFRPDPPQVVSLEDAYILVRPNTGGSSVRSTTVRVAI